MYNPTVFGVDPGLVHTGIVMLEFNLVQRQLTVDHRVVDGLDATAAKREIELMAREQRLSLLDIFIEKYVPRSGFQQDERMVQANASFQLELKGKLLRNTGVKKVVTQELMQLLHIWSFSSKTHHQDLRSAGRILVLGMMQDPALNEVLYTYCTDILEGRDWNVRVN